VTEGVAPTEATTGERLAALAGRAGARLTAHELARGVLRTAILGGELAGGTRLVQSELAQQLGVSTTPVREALRDLVGEGLIHFDPHRGAVVEELSATDAREIYDLRIILEARALELAAERITQAQVARAREVNDLMARAERPADWAGLNHEFHLGIYEAANSPRLLGIVRGLVDSSVMYVSARLRETGEERDAARAEHEEILGALEAGDVAAAVGAMTDHLRHTLALLGLDDEP
jgi:DNA-binding GntR family transcriptional regulator